MPHFKMSTISLYLQLKVSRFSNTHYNNHYLRQFTELQIIILQDRKKEKNSNTSKFPHNTVQQADLCNKKWRFFTENYKGVSRIFLNGGSFIKFWPIGGAHNPRGACLSGDVDSRIYGSWGASWGSSIRFFLIWGLRYIQLKPDTLHSLDTEHILRYTVILTFVKHPLQTWLP